MPDVELIALLGRRLRLVQQATPTNSFDAASLRAVLASLAEDVADLPAGDPTSRSALMERLALLQQRAQLEDWSADGIQWRLQELLLSTLSRLQ